MAKFHKAVRQIPEGDEAPPVNMEQFLEQHDLVWELPPHRWLDGIPLANGDMGALIWGDGRPLKISMDKYDAWEVREQGGDPGRFNYKTLRQMVKNEDAERLRKIFYDEVIPKDRPRPTRLPMPRLEIDFREAARSYEARLRLHDATVIGKMTFASGEAEWSAYVHSERNLLCIDLHYGGNLKRAELQVGLEHFDNKAKDTLKSWGYPAPELVSEEDGGHLIQRFPAGGGYVVRWIRALGQDARSERILLTILTYRNASDPVQAGKSLLQADAYDLKSEHTAWWADYCLRSFLTIPDARLENLYYIELYKLGCSSRPGKYPITLQGLWTLEGGMPPWHGDYHLDMNVQESYWPIYAANRLELGKPLYERFYAMLPRFQKQCRDFFGFEGAWSGCGVGIEGERVYGYPTTEFWPGNGAWLAHHYWLHFLYSLDLTFLRDRAVPMMRAFMRTYMSLLEAGDDGKLHIPLSNSPEYGEGSFEAWGADPVCDLALIRFLGKSLLKAQDLLGESYPKAEDWRRTLDRLADYPKDATVGLYIMAHQPQKYSHRHHSHLMGIYPLGVMSIEDDSQTAGLVLRSVDQLSHHGVSQWTGWSFPWASLIASRVGNSRMAIHMLELYLNGFIRPNTFHVNGDYKRLGICRFDYDPMTLEAGFAACAAVMEMLLQSWGGVIRLFPATPPFWAEAYFSNLRAEGAFLVTARLSEGRLRFAEIISERGETAHIKNSFGKTVTVENLRDGSQTVLTGKVLTFETSPDGCYRLYPEGETLDTELLTPLMFKRSEAERHWFGAKRLPRF